MALNHAPTFHIPRWLLFVITIFLVVFYFYFTRPETNSAQSSQAGH